MQHKTLIYHWRSPAHVHRMLSHAYRKFSSLLYTKSDIVFFGICIIILNVHLLGWFSIEPLLLSSQSFHKGMWWQFITHPFTHVSWYHLVIDAAAFICVYAGMKERRMSIRIIYFLACAAGSVIAVFMSASFYNYGYCGLSGVGHGILAINALELLVSQEKAERTAGKVAVGILLVKSAVEVFTGVPLFASLHIGDIGIALVESHIGGIAAGIIIWIVIHNIRRHRLRQLH